MSIDIGELLSTGELRLNLVCPGESGAMEKKIAWVHPTEVLDSAWSEPGEILLTCGINLPLETLETASDRSLLKAAARSLGVPLQRRKTKDLYWEICDVYLSQLEQVGVLAVGFGLGIKHPTTPRALVEAARRNGMVLFEIPLEIPFLAVSKVVYRSLDDGGDSDLRKTYVAQRHVIHALASTMPISSVIGCVASLTGGWAAYVDVSSHDEGDVVAISNRTFRHQALQWSSRLMRKRELNAAPERVRTLFGLENNHDYCVCTVPDFQSGEPSPFGVIVASIPRPEGSDTLLRSIVISAADALAVTLPRITINDRHIRRLRSISIAGLARGDDRLIMSMAKELWAGVPKEPFDLVCVEGSSAEIDHLYSTLSTAQKSDAAHTVPVFGEFEDRLWMLSAPAATDSILRGLRKRGSRYGVIRSVGWRSIQESFTLALRDLHMRHMGGEGRAVVDMSPHELMVPELVETFSNEFLGPLLDGSKESAQLMRTMRELVLCSFSVGDAARRLGVHRHTIENRERKLERLLGIDLSQESDRVKVYLASMFQRNS